MGTSNAAGLAFRIRRLVREYGTSEGRSFGRLSVAGTVPAKDVYLAYTDCHCYKLALIKGLFQRRSDFDLVKSRLKAIIEAEFEVVPLSFLVARSHRAMYVSRHCMRLCFNRNYIFFLFRCDWIFVGDLEQRSSSLISYGAEMYEANASHSSTRID